MSTSMIPTNGFSAILDIFEKVHRSLLSSIDIRMSRMEKKNQLLLYRIELEKLSTAFKMIAIDDITRAAFDQYRKTAEKFLADSEGNPFLMEQARYFLELEAKALTAAIKNFERQINMQSGYRLLP